MAAIHSTMLPLGTRAPNFSLIDTVTDSELSLDFLAANDTAIVVVFMCNHCPFVLHILPKLVEVAQHYQNKGVEFVAINSNDISAYSDDAPEKMKALALQMNFNFPFLFDETQEVAKAFQAACTPDFYLFNPQLELVYRGRFDDSTPRNNLPVTGKDLTNAIDCLLAGKEITAEQMPSIGCNIKWR